MARKKVQYEVEKLGLDPKIPWALDRNGNIAMPPRSVLASNPPSEKPFLAEIPSKPLPLPEVSIETVIKDSEPEKNVLTEIAVLPKEEEKPKSVKRGRKPKVAKPSSENNEILNSDSNKQEETQ